jgi:hypothetical protein
MNAMIYVEKGVLWRHVQSEAQLLQDNPWIEDYVIQDGPDQSNRSPVQILNACGTIYVEDYSPTHCAWRRAASIFGVVKKAYTVAGNFILQNSKVTFKGANDPQCVERVIGTLVRGDFQTRLQLVVLSVGIKKCVDVRPSGPLETYVGGLPWARVMNRIEEICSVVIFYVNDWLRMEKYFSMEPWPTAPKSCTVSVTKRGTMTVRLTWQGIEWENNNRFHDVTRVLAQFVSGLI